MKKEIFNMLLVCASLVTLGGCQKKANEVIEETFLDKLNKLENVKNAEQLSGKGKYYDGRYLLTFDQPISYENPTLGSFTQRAVLYHKDGSDFTTYYVGGYNIDNYYINSNFSHELSSLYNSSIVMLEYRFFDESSPANLANDFSLYQYCTGEYACHDFKNIIDTLDPVLGHKKIFTGASKGGYTTNQMCMYYPSSIDAFVSYVAPLCDDIYDERFYKAIYETIGDECYGEEKGQEYRDLLLEYQIELLKNRDVLVDKYWDYCVSTCKEKFSSNVTKDILFDTSVLEFSVGVWQYYHNFSSIRKTLNKPREDDPSTSLDERAEYLNSLYKGFIDVSGSGELGLESVFFTYFVQAQNEMGNYFYDFSYLRNKCQEIGHPEYLTVTADQDKTLRDSCTFTTEQISQMHYSSKTREDMIKWSQETEKEIVMIYGTGDPWYFVRMPDSENPNVHIFKDNSPHSANIGHLPKEQSDECKSVIDRLLGL